MLSRCIRSGITRSNRLILPINFMPSQMAMGFTARATPSADNKDRVPLSTQLPKQTLRGSIPSSTIKLNKDSCKIIEKVQAIKKNQKALTFADGVSCLQAIVSSGSTQNSDLALWIFNTLKAYGVVPIDVYEKTIRIQSKSGEVKNTIATYESYQTAGYNFSETMYTELLGCLIRTSNHNYSIEQLKYYYGQLEGEDLKKQGWRLPAKLYMELATAFVRVQDGDKALDILKDMTDACHEPTVLSCNLLLHQSLLLQRNKILRVLASWYMNHFHYRLEAGQLTRMLQVAAAKGDGQLALLAFQMLSKNDYTATIGDYVCLIRALLQDQDLISAVEALQELEQAHSASLTQSAAQKMLLSVRDMLSKSFSSTDKVDDLYYALLDQVRSPHSSLPAPPSVVLDAMLVALGKQGQLDRAFAVFQEYDKVFSLKHSVVSYNSLLQALSYHNEGKGEGVKSMLSVFRAMSEEGLVPDENSFSLLLIQLLNTNEQEILDQVMQQIISQSPPVDLPVRTLRRLGALYAKQGRLELSEQILKLIGQKPGRKVMVGFYGKLWSGQMNAEKGGAKEII